MPGIEEPKSALQHASSPPEVWNAIKEILSALTSLQIKTVVKGYTGLDQQGQDVEICTYVDLLQADRRYEIHESFLKDEVLKPLCEMHEEQVKQADQEVQKRMDFAHQLGTAIANAIKAAGEQ